MDDQIYFPGFEPPEAKELAYLESIMSDMAKAVEDCGGDASLLSFKPNKSGYSVVTFGVLTVFRLRLRGKQRSVSVPTSFEDLIPQTWRTELPKAEPKYIRIEIANQPLNSYTDFLCALAGAAVDRYPKDWDCCSRYLECSDAKRCIHPDKKMALSCGYRKILNAGKIYYGKNRNV